jgi:hypothetical protein
MKWAETWETKRLARKASFARGAILKDMERMWSVN